MISPVKNISTTFSPYYSPKSKVVLSQQTDNDRSFDVSIYKTKGLAINFCGKAKALYAGSFDPITKGHLDIIKGASEMFDNVVVLVAKNPTKKGFIPVDDRIKLIQSAIEEAELKNVKVDSAPDNLLTVEYARQNGANVLVRGLRTVTDFDSEMQLAEINKKLNKDVRTVFLSSHSDHSAISSSAVRSIYACNGDVSEFVPTAVKEYLENLKQQ